MLNEIRPKAKKDKSIIEEPEKEPQTNIDEKDKQKRYYKLKKNKIRNKILNFFSLNASRKFCAFYTITFPQGTTDEICYKTFNTLLTRCRKEIGLKSYLWVAERQKNNTLHFHMITNNYMPVRIVNDFMKECLRTQYNRGLINCKIKTIDSYNGVDVDNLYNSKKNRNSKERLSKEDSQRKLSYYLTKYISKNNTLSERLPWHCSRDISALFISINYSEHNQPEIVQLIADNPEAVISYYDEYFTLSFYKFQPDENYFRDLIEVNNQIFEFMNKN
ncbi:hypothetical protein LDL59_09590 [Kaistella anthropi]|nr:hypothetical protein [Kaistella anthropi]